MRYLLWFSILAILLAEPLLAAEGRMFELETRPNETTNLFPLWLDLAIPGYGAFHHREYWWALGYASAKISGAWLIYLAVKNHHYWNSVAVAAETRQQREHDTLMFANPQGNGWATAQEFRNRADSAFVMSVYAVLFETLVYGVSLYHTWRLNERQRLKSAPFYRLQNERTGEPRLDLGWQNTW